MHCVENGQGRKDKQDQRTGVVLLESYSVTMRLFAKIAEYGLKVIVAPEIQNSF